MTPATDDWMGIDRGLRWLCASPRGIISIALDTGKAHTHVSFSIIDGKLKSEGWGGDVAHVRLVARLLREAATDLERSTDHWLKWHEKNTKERS